MARAKAQKIRCHQCGAKNDVETRRCRICTGLLQVDRTTGLSAASGNDPDNFNPNDLWASQGRTAPTSDPVGEVPVVEGPVVDADERAWDQESPWEQGPVDWEPTLGDPSPAATAVGPVDGAWVSDPTFDPNAPFDPAALVVEAWGPEPNAADALMTVTSPPETLGPDWSTVGGVADAGPPEPPSWGPLWDEPPVAPPPSLDDWYQPEPVAPPPPPPPPDAAFDWDDLPPPPDDDDGQLQPLPPPPTGTI